MTTPLLWVAVAGMLAWLVSFLVREVWFRRRMKVPRLFGGPVWPTDGTIVYVRRTDGLKLEVTKNGRTETAYEFLKAESPGPGLLIGVYLGPLDWHSVVAPTWGQFRSVDHCQTPRNFPMLDLLEYARLSYFGRLVEWSEEKLLGFVAENEKWALQVGPAYLVAIADRFVNKIELLAREDQVLLPGDLVAHIRRGSQCDLFLPDVHFVGEPEIEVGTRVRAGHRIPGLGDSA